MSVKTNHFSNVNRRILWLTDKIAWCTANDKPCSMYISERESLIWLCDKVRDLAGILHRVTNRDLSQSNVTPEQEIVTLKSHIEKLNRDKEHLIKDLIKSKGKIRKLRVKGFKGP